jgi:hypothetical protein
MEEKGFTKFIKLVFDVFFNSVKDTSPPKKLHDVDYAKISRNAIIFGTGAGITYILQQFVNVDFGNASYLIIFLRTNTLSEYISFKYVFVLSSGIYLTSALCELTTLSVFPRSIGENITSESISNKDTSYSCRSSVVHLYSLSICSHA